MKKKFRPYSISGVQNDFILVIQAIRRMRNLMITLAIGEVILFGAFLAAIIVWVSK